MAGKRSGGRRPAGVRAAVKKTAKAVKRGIRKARKAVKQKRKTIRTGPKNK